MYKDFIEALNKKYKCTSADELEGLALQHYRFASSSNARAKNTIRLFEAYGLQMKGLRILDVGCAYGGFSIETAKKGAISYGVDILQSLYNFACENNRDEHYDSGSCQFILGDVTSRKFLDMVPENYFDLIIVNDVFEHVYDTVQLLENLSKIASDRCILYFNIPNGTYFDFVKREGHTGHCGLSVVRPLSWHTLTGKKIRNIYYRQYEYYKALFYFYGFSYIVPINYPSYNGNDCVKILEEKYKNTTSIISKKMSEFPKEYAKELKETMKLFSVNYQYDIEHMKHTDLLWKYSTKFWMGFAMKKQLNLEIPLSTTEKIYESVPGVDISFELKRRGNELEIQLNSGDNKENYKYSYCLIQMFRENEYVDRTEYQKNTKYKWKLSCAGLYGVEIRVKYKEHNTKNSIIKTQALYYDGEDKQ